MARVKGPRVQAVAGCGSFSAVQPPVGEPPKPLMRDVVAVGLEQPIGDHSLPGIDYLLLLDAWIPGHQDPDALTGLRASLCAPRGPP